jgi:membrane fusion protein (multidrug efflux system)
MSAFIRWTAGLLLLCCAVVSVGMWQLKARDAMVAWDPDAARAKNKPLPVRTVKVETKDLEETVGGTAVTYPAETATIMIPLSSSQVVDREVKQVNAHPGSVVKKGDVLVTFEPALFDLTVKQRQALVGKAQQEYTTLADLQRRKAASAMQVKEAEVALETAKLDLSMAQRDLQLCQITSPINGVVEQLEVVPGMRIGGSGTLVLIHKLDPIYVQMDYPMERIDALKLGQEAEVNLDAFAQESFSGKVIRISPIVSTKTRVLPIMIEVPNPDNRIKAGISGFARIKMRKPGTTALPPGAVIEKREEAMVVCIAANHAKLRLVRTGSLTQAGEIEVLDGLKSGDEVVIFGQDSVKEKDLVNVDWRKWTHRDYPTP